MHSASAAYLDGLTRPGAEWDIALVVWTPNVPDAQAYLNLLLDSQHIGGTNVAGFASGAYDRALQRAATDAAGPRRDSAPTAPWTYRLRATPRRSPRSASSTSRRSSPSASTGAASCFGPALDLTAVCLK